MLTGHLGWWDPKMAIVSRMLLYGTLNFTFLTPRRYHFVVLHLSAEMPARRPARPVLVHESGARETSSGCTA